MPITSHFVAKNSIVVFGALTDYIFIVSDCKKKTCLSPPSIQFFFHPLDLLSEFETVGSADQSFSTGSTVGSGAFLSTLYLNTSL